MNTKTWGSFYVVKRIVGLSAINVADVVFGGEVDLPKTVTATLNDAVEATEEEEAVEATVVTLDITWTEDEAFDTEVAGEYTFAYVLSIQEDEELEFVLSEELAEGTVTVTVLEADKLVVESVIAITATTVDVEITAPGADVLGATVEVKDAEGTAHAVKSIDISEGDTAASFDFVTAVDEKVLTGVWSVDGKEYNFDLIKQFEAILEAANKGDQLALLNALEAAGIENINEDLIAEYVEAIVDADPSVETLADIQTAINKANEDNVSADDKAEALLAVKDANTQVALLKALQQFERVNADWAKDYAGGKIAEESGKAVVGFIIDPVAGPLNYNEVVMKDTDATAKANFDYDDVQTVINAVNERQIKLAWNTAWNSAKADDLAKAKTLAETYAPADTEEEKAEKEFSLDGMSVLDAVIKVNSASTNKSFKDALVALSNLEKALVEKYKGTAYDGKIKAQLDLDEVNDNLLAKYREKLGSITIPGEKNQPSDIQGVINDVNGTNSNSLLEAVKKADNTKEELAKALKAYGVVQVADTNLDAYLAKGFTEVTSVETAQTQVDTVNLEEVKSESTTAANIIEKLNVFGLDNVIVTNAVAYVADAKNDTNGHLVKVAADTNGKNAETVKKVKAAVKAVNDEQAEAGLIKDINLAKNAEEVKFALDKLAIDSYVDVPNADKLYIAEQVFVIVEGESSPDATTPFANKAAVETDLDTESTGIIAKYDALVTEFNASEITSTSGLIASFGKLEHDAFDNLTNAEKAIVAQNFLANYPTDKDGEKVEYVTLADVIADLEAEIAGL